jgi:DnaK suppressor protein
MELRDMFERRRSDIETHVRQRMRAIREAQAISDRPQTDAPDDVADDDIDFALVRMQVETLERIKSALARLAGGEYGMCDDCEGDIEDKRLEAMPFATRCRSCQERAERFERPRRSLTALRREDAWSFF